jgi:hypothetical protein
MAATNKRQLNSKDLRLLGVSLPELTHIPLAAATTMPLPLPAAYSPRTPRETSALLDDEEAAACDAVAEPWQDTCKPVLANGADAEGRGELHVHMCAYCGNASTKEPCEVDFCTGCFSRMHARVCVLREGTPFLHACAHIHVPINRENGRSTGAMYYKARAAWLPTSKDSKTN